jgi:Skp family chaperone for outer membrane proteins
MLVFKLEDKKSNGNLDLTKEDIELFLEQRENELKEKYKKLEDHLTNKFKVETGLFFENIQKEMEEILANKGLSKAKRL